MTESQKMQIACMLRAACQPALTKEMINRQLYWRRSEKNHAYRVQQEDRPAAATALRSSPILE